MKKRTTTKQIKEELWHRGELKWLLYSHQRPIYNKMREVIDSEDVDANSYVLDISRQFGKSFCMFLLAVEQCLRTPFQTVVYIAPLKKQVIEIVTENTFRAIFESAPKKLVPVLKDSELTFCNGSRIRLAGSDNKNYEGLRGGLAHLVLLDEAGFMSDLDTGVLPTVLPMTKTTGGKVLFASTPPETLDHCYYDVLREHDESGHISTFTIMDDKSLTEKQFKTIVSACKGQETTLFKREYLCQRIAEQSQQVIPELSMEMAVKMTLLDDLYKLDPLFKYYHKYVVADWGGKDFTAIVFAHYNYYTKRLVVEDQLNLTGSLISSSRIAQSVKDKVNELWPDPACREVVRYICDSNNVLIQNDMVVNHNLPFVSTSKDRLAEQMVQKVRDWVYDNRLEFAPAAQFTLKSCMSGWWSKNKDKFAHSKIYGHYDHLAAVVYLVRNVNTITDPIPGMYAVDPYHQYVDIKQLDNQREANRIGNIFKPRSGLSYK